MNTQDTDTSKNDDQDSTLDSNSTTKDKSLHSSRPEYVKVTGEELEYRMREWFTQQNSRIKERITRRTPETKQRITQRIIAVVLGMSLVALVLLNVYSERSFTQEYDQDKASIDALTLAKQKYETTSTTSIASAHDIAAMTAKATRIATDVAMKQQEYAGLYFAVNDAPSSEDGVPSQASLQTVEHRRILAPFWDSQTFIVSESMAYSYSTTPYFDQDKIDPRFPWYVRYDGNKATDPTQYTWSVESVTPKIEAPMDARVVWVNKDQTGTILAWASATYTDATGVLSQLELVITASGAKHQMGSAPKTKVPEL